MADSLTRLLFEIAGNTMPGQTAVSDLKNHFGSELGAIGKTAEQTFEEVGKHLNLFIGERIPLVGGLFLRLTENIRGLHVIASTTEGSILKLSKAIDEIATKSGKSVTDVGSFIAQFGKLENQAQRDAAAIAFFGETTAQKLIPQLDRANKQMTLLAQSGTDVSSALSGVASSGEAAASSFAGMAGPIGIAIVGILASIAAAAELTDQLFKLSESTAQWKGHLFDLSKELGISVETLSGFEILAKASGLDLGQLNAALGIFQKHLEAGQDPLSKDAKLLKDLGVNSLDTEDALRQTLKALAEMPEGFQQTAYALDLFGRSGKSILAILKETHGDLDTAIAKFAEMGLIVSEKDAEAAHEFEVQMALLSFQIRAAGAVIVKEAIPAIAEIAKSLSENQQAVHEVATVLGDLTFLITGPVKGALAVLETGVHSLELAWLGAYRAVLLYQGVSLDVALQSGPPTGAQGFGGVRGGMAGPFAGLRGGAEGSKPEKEKKGPKDTTEIDEFHRVTGELKSQVSEREAAYSEETANLKHQYDERLTDFDQFIADSKVANAAREKDALLSLAAEALAADQAAQAGTIKKKEAARLTQEIDKEIEKVKRETRKADEQLDEQSYKHKLKLSEEYQQQLEALTQKKDADQIADLKRILDLTLQDESLSYLQRIALIEKFNRDAEAIRLTALDRQEQQLTDEVLAIATRYAESHKISIEEAFDSQLVTDAMAERAQKIEAIEYERSRIIKETSNQNIDAYKKETDAAAKAATGEGKSTPGGAHVGVGPNAKLGINLNPFGEAVDLINKNFKEGSLLANVYTSALGAVDQAAQGLAQGIGEMVKSFVLLGNAGGGFRKMAAEVIASIAQQATVQAVYQAALGLAWEALFWFTGDVQYQKAASTAFAAAIAFGLVAATAVPIGRALAGNQFQQSSAASGGASSGSGSSGSTSQSNQPATVREEFRQMRPVIIQLHGEAAAAFNFKVIGVIENDVNTNGRMRTVIVDTAKKGS